MYMQHNIEFRPTVIVSLQFSAFSQRLFVVIGAIVGFRFGNLQNLWWQALRTLQLTEERKGKAQIAFAINYLP